MTRRVFILANVVVCLANAESARASVRGRLTAGGRLTLDDGKTILLQGDDATLDVLADVRVQREVIEARGRFVDASRFEIDPIYKKALFVLRGDRLLVITYWCEVCAIRTYSPGNCQCCQDPTELDPRDPALESGAPSA